MKLGESIKVSRKMRGMTQVRLAHLVGVSETSISLIEQGHTRPHRKTLGKICLHLQVSEHMLHLMSITGDDIPTKNRHKFKALKLVLDVVIKQLII